MNGTVMLSVRNSAKGMKPHRYDEIDIFGGKAKLHKIPDRVKTYTLRCGFLKRKNRGDFVLSLMAQVTQPGPYAG